MWGLGMYIDLYVCKFLRILILFYYDKFSISVQQPFFAKQCQEKNQNRPFHKTIIGFWLAQWSFSKKMLP